MEDNMSSTVHAPEMNGHMPTAGEILSHNLAPDDLDNPMNWPLHRRVYTTAASWACAFTVAFGLTAYTAGINDVVRDFHVSTTVAILGFALYLWGIAFAPIFSPHLAERLGRSVLYFGCILLFSLFTLGVAYAQNFATIAVCRFFAGLFGGPCLVLIEGTFADIWSANTTNTYYAVLNTASYFGAACGPFILGFIINDERGWQWTQYVTLMLALATLIFLTGMSESYQREIPRRRNKRRGLPPPEQPPAGSGVTFSEMVRVTVVSPVIGFFTDPVFFMATFYLGFNFGSMFQFFITVPAVLNMLYNFSLRQSGLAFLSALVGALLASVISIIIEQIIYRRSLKTTMHGASRIELRLIPAMYGGSLMFASLFWIGWTAKPTVNPIVPIVGTGVYVWGNASVLIALIPYIFDAFLPAGTLSALTIMAVTRLVLGGLIPLVILQDFTNLGGGWALAIFGFIALALIPIPFILFKFGPHLRERSKYNKMSPADEKTMAMMAHNKASHERNESMPA